MLSSSVIWSLAKLKLMRSKYAATYSMNKNGISRIVTFHKTVRSSSSSVRFSGIGGETSPVRSGFDIAVPFWVATLDSGGFVG